MDAKEISKKVRDYFYEIHGQFGVVGFRIENVLYDEKGNIIGQLSVHFFNL